MYSVKNKSVVEQLAQLKENKELIRVNDLVSLYMAVKNSLVSMEALGPKFEIVLPSIKEQLHLIEEEAKSRCLLDYCEAVFENITEEQNPVVDVVLAFIVLSSEKGSDDWRNEGKDLKASMLNKDYVLDVNYSEQGKSNGFFVSYNPSKVPEGENFSTIAQNLKGVKKVHKVA